MPHTVRTVLRGAAHRPIAAGGPCEDRPSLLEREVLLAHVLGVERLDLVVHPDRPVTPRDLALYQGLLERRSLGEPMAQLVGKKEFFGRDFAVTPAVLTPRPETELVVEEAMAALKDRQDVLFADLGAGSGCIGLTLALERPSWRGILLEKSPAALTVCRINAHRLAVRGAALVLGDMKRPPLAPASLDLVVANPPYIAPDDNSVAEDVRRYEPMEALFARDNGLELLEAAMKAAAKALKRGGVLVVEHGCNQKAAVQRLLAQKNFFGIFTKKDLAGLDRVSVARV